MADVEAEVAEGEDAARPVHKPLWHAVLRGTRRDSPTPPPEGFCSAQIAMDEFFFTTRPVTMPLIKGAALALVAVGWAQGTVWVQDWWPGGPTLVWFFDGRAAIDEVLARAAQRECKGFPPSLVRPVMHGQHAAPEPEQPQVASGAEPAPTLKRTRAVREIPSASRLVAVDEGQETELDVAKLPSRRGWLVRCGKQAFLTENAFCYAEELDPTMYGVLVALHDEEILPDSPFDVGASRRRRLGLASEGAQ